MNFSMLRSDAILAKFLRYPLRLLPTELVVPVLRGPLRGSRWIVGSSLHRCWLGFYEYEKQRLICKEVRPNTVFYDVGANVGFYSLLASALVRSGKVFAFEPVPRNVSYLKRHLALNHVSNAEVLGVAIADRNGAAQFQVEESGLMGHLSVKGGITVPAATLDSLMEDGGILPPDYIKLDIEGAELLALRGASECVHQYRPMIFLATHGHEVHEACCGLLESWGYECQLLDGVTAEDRGEVVARFGC